MRYLGVDVGEKTVGVAYSDENGRVAFPLSEVETKRCIEWLKNSIKEKQIEEVVLGESVHIDGTKNPIMERIEQIATALREQVPVTLHPEHFSTKEAKRLGKGSDAEAATIILQSYLDGKNEGRDV